MSSQTEYLLGKGDLDRIDRARIERQNRGDRIDDWHRFYGKAAWGVRNAEFMAKLWYAGVDPQEIAEIGTSDDAMLIETKMRVFSDAHISIFEINSERLAAARQTLVSIFGEEEVIRRVSFIAGDAAVTMKQQDKKFDLISYQLLDQHLTDNKMREVLKACADSLSENGKLTTADLDFNTWYVRVNPHYASDADVQNLAREVNAAILTGRQKAYRLKTMHDWGRPGVALQMEIDGAREHANAVHDLSGGRLHYDPELSMPPHLVEFSGEDMEVDLMEGITNFIALMEPNLKDSMERYICALREGKLIGVYPALFQQCFSLENTSRR